MKIKYLRLTKKERKEVKQNFYQTKQGIYLKKKLNMVIFSAISLILISIYLIIEAFIKDISIMQYIYAFTILFFGVIFLTSYFKIKITKLNDYITKPKNK